VLAAGRPRNPGLQFRDALFQFFEPRPRAFQHLALRVEFVAPGEIQLAKIGAQHGAEIPYALNWPNGTHTSLVQWTAADRTLAEVREAMQMTY